MKNRDIIVTAASLRGAANLLRTLTYEDTDPTHPYRIAARRLTAEAEAMEAEEAQS